MKYLLLLIISCVILSGCEPVPEATSPSASDLAWRQFTPAQVRAIDEQMDEYIDREHAGIVLYADDAGMRYGMCRALEGNAWNWDRFVASGESLVMQGEILPGDWLLMRDLASYLMYLVQQPTQDAYFESRRAGERVPPMPTMGNAYCAYNLLLP